MIDIDLIRRQVLLSEEVAKDVKLERHGNSWMACCPIHQDKSPSFSIFTGKDGVQRFRCFGCDAHGDVIDYFMITRQVDKKEALRALSSHDDMGKPTVERSPVKSPYDDITPLPLGDWAISANRDVTVWNPKKGKFTKLKPISAHRYECGYVLRCQLNGSKKKWTPAIMRCRLASGMEAWCMYAFPEPRPLYGTVSDKVIVVEGEKCADTLAAVAQGCTVVTWSGGVAVVGKTNWEPLKSASQIIIWPDADNPGVTAAKKILDLVGKGRILDVSRWSDGYDVADAIASGWDWKRISDFILPDGSKQRTNITIDQPSGREEDEADQFAWVSRVKWEEGTKQLLIPGVAEKMINPRSITNAYLLLKHHIETRDIFLHDVFADSVVVTSRPPWCAPGNFTVRALIPDEDCVGFRMWLELFGIKISKGDAKDILVKVASENTVNPPKIYFDSLVWDGVPRLDNWLTYYLGVPSSEYSQFVGRKWLTAAVARVYEPGCKFDTALILEGSQYLGKSLALSILATVGGKRYFTDEGVDFHSKDSIMLCQGKLIVEMAELASWHRADTNEIKAFITRQIDSYRPPYGMSIKDRPRMFVLAGTVNPSGGYMSDATGNRRYWPVKCTSIDKEALENDREQLWAEAVVAYKNKEPLYLTEEQYALAKVEQSERYSEDALADDIDRAVESIIQSTGMPSIGVKVNDVFEFLKISSDKKSNQMMSRIKSHLTHRGYYEKRINYAGRMERRWIKKEVDSCPEAMYTEAVSE